MTKIQRAGTFLLELAIVSINFFCVYFLLRHFKLFYHLDLITEKEIIASPQTWHLYFQVFVLVSVIWIFLLWRREEHQHFNVESYGVTARHLLVKGLLFFVIFTSVSFILKFGFLSRMFIVVYTASSIAWLTLTRWMILYRTKESLKKGHDVRHILLVGTGRRAQEFMSHVAKHTEWGYRIIGLLDCDLKMKGESIAGHLVVGILEDLPDILEREVVDEVFFITPRDWLENVRKCILYCEAVGVPATISTELFDFEIAFKVPKTLEGKTYLTIETCGPKGWGLLLKRIFDIFVSATFLILTSPIFLIVACAIRLTSSGPIFFRQVRSGRNGRRFYLYKFRSMGINAEDKLAELQHKNEMTGPVFKITNDPRVTKIGKFLRKTSLDEFPQFWNVLKGDMSVVGPRPPLPSEVEKYEPWHRRRLSMQPGITCIWQISGRNGVDFEKWMEMDLRYIDNWSLGFDLKILSLTANAVFAGTGK